MSRDLSALLDLAAGTAVAAGVHLQTTRPAQVLSKAHAWDLVTDVDTAAEDLIRDRLAPSGIPVLGEERGGPDPLSTLAWVVDPIDGTVNYVQGLPLYGVNIALVDHGTVLLGVTHLPVLGETYTATLGGGAFCGSRRLRMDVDGDAENAPVAANPFDDAARQAAIVRTFGAASVDMAWTAAGLLGGVTYREVQPWDVAPGVLMILEAGGTVRARHPEHHPLTGSLLAGHPAVLDRVEAADTRVRAHTEEVARALAAATRKRVSRSGG